MKTKPLAITSSPEGNPDATTDRVVHALLAGGALLAAALWGRGVQAHECRELGNDYHITDRGQYYLCVGFSKEEPGVSPAAGERNNIDMIPIWINRDLTSFSSIDTDKGDIVDITAKLIYLNDDVYEVPLDDEGNYTDPFFFFTTPNVGFESVPMLKSGVPLWERNLKINSKGDWNGYANYHNRKDVVLPYKGMYVWQLTGTLQKKGRYAAQVFTKYVCQQPRVPYGPYDGSDPANSLGAAPDGYYDCVRYPSDANSASKAHRATRSPTVDEWLQRRGLTPDKRQP